MLGNAAFASTAFSEEAVVDFPNVTVLVSGVSANAVVGDLPAYAVGVGATTAVNSVTIIGDARIEVSGVQAQAINNGLRQDALVVITTVDAEGWGRSGWSAGAWSTPVATNVEAVTSVGDAEAIPVTYADAVGVEAVSGITGVDVYPGTGIVVPVTGVQATALLGPRGVKVWGRIIPVNTGPWIEVEPTTDQDWIRVAPNATNEYTEMRP